MREGCGLSQCLSTPKWRDSSLEGGVTCRSRTKYARIERGALPYLHQVQKMERIVLCLAVGLLCMGGTSAQQANNATYASGNGTVAFVSGSGSGSGNDFNGSK